MMWMVLARVIVNKPGSALLFGLSQGITVMLLGFFGSHGAFSIVSYSLPGLAVEVFALVFKGYSLLVLCLLSTAANMTGTLIVATMIMQLPLIMLTISLLTAMLSGMMGGYFAQIVLTKLKKYRIISQ
jgi:energy-coupling factor transport system substrate-specific component